MSGLKSFLVAEPRKTFTTAKLPNTGDYTQILEECQISIFCLSLKKKKKE